jgi:hypothetical protein
MKKRIVGLFVFAVLMVSGASAQNISILRVDGVDVVVSVADSTNFYNSIRNTKFQIGDSVGEPGTPPAGQTYLYFRGVLGTFVKYSDGARIRLDSVGVGGGGLTWADTTVLATLYDLSLVSGADSTSWPATDYDVSLKAPLASPTFTGLVSIDDSLILNNAGGSGFSATISGNVLSGSRSFKIPTISGTFATTASSPVGLNSTTGVISADTGILATQFDISTKLNSADTTSLSDRINLKADTVNQTFTGTTTTTGRFLTDTIDTRTSDGTLILKTGKNRTTDGNTKYALIVQDSVGEVMLKVMANGGLESRKNGGHWWTGSAIGIRDNLSVEDGVWVDENIGIQRYEPGTATTLADSAPSARSYIRVATVASWIRVDNSIEIGTAWSGGNPGGHETVRVDSINTDTVYFTPKLGFTHSAGEPVRLFRHRAAIHPVSSYLQPAGTLRIGGEMTRAEADSVYPTAQKIDLVTHTQYTSPLAGMWSPMVLQGGGVDTTAPASMAINVDSGIFIASDTNSQSFITGIHVFASRQNGITIAPADNDSNRIDVIYWREDGVVKVVTGTKAITPTAPTVPGNGIKLAEVAVDSDLTSIPRTKITDYRTLTMTPIARFGTITFGTSNQNSIKQNATSSNYLDIRGVNRMNLLLDDATGSDDRLITITSTGIYLGVTYPVPITVLGYMLSDSLIGGTASGGNLFLESTTHATKGKIYLGTAANYDEPTGALTLSTASSKVVVGSDAQNFIAQDATSTYMDVQGNARINLNLNSFSGADKRAMNMTTTQILLGVTRPLEVVMLGYATVDTVRGSTASGGDLLLQSTSHATKGTVTIDGEIDADGTVTGRDAFTTTATTDTVTISGASTNDNYSITYYGTTVPNANDVTHTIQPTATGFVLHRAASGTSGITYMWIRLK